MITEARLSAIDTAYYNKLRQTACESKAKPQAEMMVFNRLRGEQVAKLGVLKDRLEGRK